MMTMADIARYPFLRHLRGTATTHIQHVRATKTRHSGSGQSFWFRPLSAVLSEVPIDDRELPLLFHARTIDFQDVSVQATLTYRLVAPTTAATRIDFSIDPDTGRWRAMPLEQVASLLTETAQQHALDLLVRTTLTTALTDGVTAVRDAIEAGLAGDTRLAETGIALIGVRVVAIRPEPEVERALQTPTREQVQQQADRAIYERRAVAVERERAIGENELQSQIELAKREEQLVAQRGANARREADEAAAAAQINVAAEAARTERMAEAHAAATRLQGAARAAAEAAKLEAYRDVSSTILMALAAQELATNLPQINSLVLTPDLIAPVLARLGSAQ
jgi:regulator of protease activity HflC (stomatin/prohibitin superfamily)